MVSILIISGDLCVRLYIFIGVLKRGKSIILLERGSFRVFLGEDFSGILLFAPFRDYRRGDACFRKLLR